MKNIRAEMQAFLILSKDLGRKPTKKEIKDYIKKYGTKDIDEILNDSDDDWP